MAASTAWTANGRAGADAVVAVRYGSLLTDLEHCFVLAGREGTDPRMPLRMDYFLWVLWRDGRPIVVDTGFDPEVAARRGRECLIEPAVALARVGVDPDEVDLVILTHLHYDHIGNVDLFPSAQIVVDEREFEFWTGPFPQERRFLDHVESVEIGQLLAAREEARLVVVGPSHEVLPGIRLQRVGGHTAGQQIVSVETASGLVVLASDAIHFYRELELDWPFAIFHDLDAMHCGYRTLRALEREGATIVAGHDPLVMDRFEPIADFAVRVA